MCMSKRKHVINMKTTYQQFAHFAIEHQNEQCCDDMIATCDDINDIDDVMNNIRHYAMSCTSRVVEYLKTFASFDVSNNDYIKYDVNKFDVIRAFALLIMNEYGCINENEIVCNLWNDFDLHGDDDVDYNASYLMMIVDFIEYYHKYNSQ